MPSIGITPLPGLRFASPLGVRAALPRSLAHGGAKGDQVRFGAAPAEHPDKAKIEAEVARLKPDAAVPPSQNPLFTIMRNAPFREMHRMMCENNDATSKALLQNLRETLQIAFGRDQLKVYKDETRSEVLTERPFETLREVDGGQIQAIHVNPLIGVAALMTHPDLGSARVDSLNLDKLHALCPLLVDSISGNDVQRLAVYTKAFDDQGMTGLGTVVDFIAKNRIRINVSNNVVTSDPAYVAPPPPRPKAQTPPKPVAPAPPAAPPPSPKAPPETPPESPSMRPGIVQRFTTGFTAGMQKFKWPFLLGGGALTAIGCILQPLWIGGLALMCGPLFVGAVKGLQAAFSRK